MPSKKVIPRRDAVRLAGGLVAAPAVLRSIPAHAESAGIKIGLVNPRTGQLAAFGEADDFILKQVIQAVGAGV